MTPAPNSTQTDIDKPLGRRARKALAVRRALFDAGLNAFDRQPLGVVSILDITEAADVAKGVFYLQFRSKDDFLIALWEDCQRVLLDAVRAAVSGCSSAPARLEAAIAEYARAAVTSPAATRFMVRMSGYFSDEIGQPGELARLRREYLEQLAATIAGVKLDAVKPEDLELAAVVDACCRGMISHAVQLGTPLPPESHLVRVVRGAARPRSQPDR